MNVESTVVTALLRGHWYDAVAALFDEFHDVREATGLAHALAVAAKRTLDLDAEDFGDIASGFSERLWAQRLASACFPLQPRADERGALLSLIPLYELMLEVIELRSRRQEPLQVVVTAHLIGEYLPQLAWEGVLGHAGDPLLMGASVGSGGVPATPNVHMAPRNERLPNAPSTPATETWPGTRPIWIAFTAAWGPRWPCAR